MSPPRLPKPHHVRLHARVDGFTAGREWAERNKGQPGSGAIVQALLRCLNRNKWVRGFGVHPIYSPAFVEAFKESVAGARLGATVNA